HRTMLLTSAFEQVLDLLAGILDQALAILKHSIGLDKVVRDRATNGVHQIEQQVLIEEDPVSGPDPRAGLDHVLELIDQIEKIYLVPDGWVIVCQHGCLFYAEGSGRTRRRVGSRR